MAASSFISSCFQTLLTFSLFLCILELHRGAFADTSDKTWIDGPASNHGKIHISFHGKTGLLCSHTFGKTEAEIACSEMNYPNGGESWLYNITNFSKSSVIQLIKCYPLMTQLISCHHNQFDPNSNNCTADKGVGVTCIPNYHVVSKDEYTAHWHNSNPNAQSKGVLLAYHHSKWQTVCLSHDMKPDDITAIMKVFCRATGCTGENNYLTAKTNHEVLNEDSNGKVMIKGSCSGSENDIRNCDDAQIVETDDCMDFWLSCSGGEEYKCNWLPESIAPSAVQEVDHTGPIVGAIVVGIVAIIGVTIYCYFQRKKKKRALYKQRVQDKDYDEENPRI